MFEQDSRYFNLEDRTYSDGKGHKIVYKIRRIIPQPEAIGSMVTVRVLEGQRIDQISSSTLGKGKLCWRIGDANPAISLTDLEKSGLELRIPIIGTK